MSNKSAMRFSAIGRLRFIDRLKQRRGGLLAASVDLLQVRGLSVSEIAFGLVRQALDSHADILFLQLKYLAGTAVAMGDIAEAERFFSPVALIPEVVQAVQE